MADAATGSNGIIRMDVSESNLNPTANTSQVNYAFYLIENGGANAAWANGIAASVDWVSQTVLWSGSFNFDWRAGGNQVTQIVASSFSVTHQPNGTGSVLLQGNIGSTGTSSAGGPASVQQGLTLTTLVRLPNTPTGLTATRVSDTQTKLNWNQTYASNGVPTNEIIQSSVNGGAYATLVTQGNSTSATVATAPNRKTTYRVQAKNSAGSTAFSTASTPIYTTPAVPTAVTATKQPDLSILVAFTDNVAYTEHTHEVWHGTVTGGVTTWDGSALATVPSGTTTYSDASPDPSKAHVYEVRAVAGALQSAFSVSNTVQLLVAPNKPTVPAMSARADKAQPLAFTWVHNPVDTTSQTAYEFATSTDGGTTWTSSGKVASTASTRTIAGGTYAANTALTTRVRTWGSATSGGSDGTGASPWSDLRTVTYKTAPTASITSPANGATLHDATVRVNVGFTQSEGATFVKAQLELLDSGGTSLETLDSNIQVGITLATQVQDGESYTVRARVQDSNGLWSGWASNGFSVTYLSPVPAVVTTSYLPDTGYGQLDITIAAPGPGQDDASTVTILRTIDGVQEVVVQDYPADSDMTFLDTTPTIHGTNTYTIITTSDLGAQTTVTATLVTSECRRAYLSKGVGFSVVGVFGGNLSVDESLSVASDTMAAAGRSKPIGLFGMETSVQLKVESFIFDGFGSSRDDLRALLLLPGRACYRDPSGRRVFGAVKGSVGYKKTDRGDFSFTLTEAD